MSGLIIVWFCSRRQAAVKSGSRPSAALSSDAHRLLFSVISCGWGFRFLPLPVLLLPVLLFLEFTSSSRCSSTRVLLPERVEPLGGRPRT